MQSLSEMMLRWDALEIVLTGIEEVTQQSIFCRVRQNYCTHQTKRSFQEQEEQPSSRTRKRRKAHFMSIRQVLLRRGT